MLFSSPIRYAAYKYTCFSLKCGGVGLNLTRANRVISLDLGWSEAIESQAFDRVHRLGQTRSVTVERLVISNTVEDRILALQETKRNLADGSLGEGNGKKIGRMYLLDVLNFMILNSRIFPRIDRQAACFSIQHGYPRQYLNLMPASASE